MDVAGCDRRANVIFSTFAAARGEAPPLRVQGLPLVKPPYGSIVAIDMDKGEILWKIANAETADNVRKQPALQGLDIPRTGRASNTIGLLVTRTLLIAGEPGTFTTPSGRVGAMLRASTLAMFCSSTVFCNLFLMGTRPSASVDFIWYGGTSTCTW